MCLRFGSIQFIGNSNHEAWTWTVIVTFIHIDSVSRFQVIQPIVIPKTSGGDSSQMEAAVGAFLTSVDADLEQSLASADPKNVARLIESTASVLASIVSSRIWNDKVCAELTNTFVHFLQIYMASYMQSFLSVWSLQQVQKLTKINRRATSLAGHNASISS